MQDVTIVFDLDGTLVDTAPDLVDATNHALARLQLAPLSDEIVRPWISFGARRMLIEALACHGQQRPEGDIDRLLENFLSYYEANIAKRSRPFPGIVEAIDTLRGRGARLAVCTNKREALSLRLLEALALKNHFAAIAGRDTFPVCKPHPDHLLGAIRLASGDNMRAVMIGDSAVDVATAKAARIPIVLVSFGYTDVPAAELGADALIECHTGLIATLEQFF